MPARVLLLSNMPVDITIDRLVRWRDIMPSRVEQAAARGDAMPLSPAELLGYPELATGDGALGF